MFRILDSLPEFWIVWQEVREYNNLTNILVPENQSNGYEEGRGSHTCGSYTAECLYGNRISAGI
ncbi:hypothetical protein LBYZC6_03240 [Lacrimispora brassicae]